MARTKQVVIGCRGDAVSLCHLDRVVAALREAHPHVEFIGAREAGTRKDSRRGVSVVMQKLAKEEIDVAIMDARWIPLQLAPPVEIAAVFERANPFDVLIAEENVILDEQPENTCIASSEAVKRGQLLYYRPDLKLVEGEDDYEALFAEMKSGAINAFVCPASDVEALNQQEHVVEVFTTSICTPVAGQGALALLANRDKKHVLSHLKCCNDPSTFAEVEIERTFLEFVLREGKGPVGVLVSVEDGEFELEAAIAAPDGSEKISGNMKGALGERSRIIEKLATELLSSGGSEIISLYRKIRGSC